MSDILAIVARRLPSTQDKFIAITEGTVSITVIGHAALYAQAIELIERALESCGLENTPVQLTQDDEINLLTWTLETSAQSILRTADVIEKAVELSEHLLRPYNCRLRRTESTLSLELCSNRSGMKSVPAIG